MASIDDVLQSMLDDMKKYEEEYNATTEKINMVVKEYTSKINELQQQRLALQEEGNKKIDILNARKEQLSGKHSSLYEQYKKFAGKEPDLSNVTGAESKKSVVKKETKKQTVKKVDKKEGKTVSKDVKPEKSGNLSPDEIEKLARITDENNNKTENYNVDIHGNEIPDYLQDAYRK